LTGHTDAVHAVAFSLDMKWLVSGSFDDKVKIWEVENGRLAQTLDSHSADVNGVAFSFDGKWLASVSDDKNIILWKANEK
jgi:WD40 repeat protein